MKCACKIFLQWEFPYNGLLIEHHSTWAATVDSDSRLIRQCVIGEGVVVDTSWLRCILLCGDPFSPSGRSGTWELIEPIFASKSMSAVRDIVARSALSIHAAHQILVSSFFFFFFVTDNNWFLRVCCCLLVIWALDFQGSKREQLVSVGSGTLFGTRLEFFLQDIVYEK